MNEAHIYLRKPAHYWFQLHPKNWNAAKARENKWPEDGYGRPPQHLETLQQIPCPIWMQDVDERIPTSVKYPYDEIVERYGYDWVDGKKRPYLTSTAAYMLALLVYEHDNGMKVDRVRLAGIELAIGTEYFHQRGCVEHWLGIATGRGIRFDQNPYGSALLNGPIYAREHADPLYPESMQTLGNLRGRVSEIPVISMAEDEAGEPVGL